MREKQRRQLGGSGGGSWAQCRALGGFFPCSQVLEHAQCLTWNDQHSCSKSARVQGGQVAAQRSTGGAAPPLLLRRRLLPPLAAACCCRLLPLLLSTGQL